MKSFIQYITELKIGKAMRRRNSKKLRYSSAVSDASVAADNRQRARAMTASMAGEHEKAGAIASVIDAASSKRNNSKTRSTFEGEKFAGGIADKVQSYQNMITDIKRGISSLRDNGVNTKMGADALKKYRSGTAKEPNIEDKNRYNHILRSQLATAAERLGGNASDVAPFVKEKPLPKSHSKEKNY